MRSIGRPHTRPTRRLHANPPHADRPGRRRVGALMDASAWDERYAAQERVWSKGPNAFVAEHTADLAPGRAVDLAGGEGRNAIWLAQRGWDVELVDFSQVALDKASGSADRAGVAISCRLADVTTGLHLDPADLVVLAYLQLPPAPSRAAVRSAAATVAAGGTLLIVAHAKRNVTDGVGGPPDPQVNRSVDELCTYLDGTGLDLEVAREVTRTVATDTGPRDAIDVLVRARRPVRDP
jgi:SAM-dependent methyltransferase